MAERRRGYREKGIPASQLPAEVVEPLIGQVMAAPDDKILEIGEIESQDIPKPPGLFDSFVCEECGDTVVEKYGRHCYSAHGLPRLSRARAVPLASSAARCRRPKCAASAPRTSSPTRWRHCCRAGSARD